MRKSLCIALCVLLLAGCGGKNEIDPSIYASDGVSLVVKGKTVYDAAATSSQYSFNRSLRTFRAGNDDMTSYFTLTCRELPERVDQEIVADLRWTAGNSVKTQNNVSFKVERYEKSTGLVWLWCAADKTGVVVKILD